MSTILITQDMFNNMNFDTDIRDLNSPISVKDDQEMDYKPSALIIFANSDINAAIYHLMKSLNSPFEPQAIATVLVQEAVKKGFVEKLFQQSRSYSFDKIRQNEKFNKAVETAKTLNANFITSAKNPFQHSIVCDFTHEQLGSSTPSGIVTLHTFRTAKEAISLIKKESLEFTNISIWQENHGHAYELVPELRSQNFFINCHLAPINVLEESINQRKNYVTIEKSYHYETLQLNGMQKSIVFPIGSIFAN